MAMLNLGQDPPEAVLDALTGLFYQSQFAQVAAQAEVLVQQYPGSFLLWNILGAGSMQCGRIDLAVLSFGKACALKPDFPEANYNFGNALNAQGRLDAAAVCYRRTIALKPDLAEAHFNLGTVLERRGELDAAAACYRRATGLKPQWADAHNNLGNMLKAQDKLDEAIACYAKALAARPEFTEAEAHMLHLHQHIGYWQGFETLAPACARLAAQAGAPPPFTMLAMVDDAEVQLRFSLKWAAERYGQAPLALPARPAARPERLRIGYFSADFHDHATLYLMTGLLREHDRSKFEIHAYSYGQIKSGTWRERVKNLVDHFFDIADQPADAVTALARSHRIDIAVDLKGYTTNTRGDLFQYRLAPIQINYLGYPGSIGADFVDYILADPVVIPDDQRPFYSESVIRLPHSYQPNDNTREIAATTTTRADFGLPETGFVFCCFNNSFKISPREFAIWMRLLGRIEGSVLWLLKANPWCESNLRREATARGIAPERLVFADRADHAQHLARHKHADLFVDTFNYNAHTTASDALWAGLPVVTKMGQQFAARVTASLLTAIGLPELITHTEAEYEALIGALATDPGRLSAIRVKLADDRRTHPLFDTRLYTRHFEAGLQQAYDLYFTGQNARDICVAPIDGHAG